MNTQRLRQTFRLKTIFGVVLGLSTSAIAAPSRGGKDNGGPPHAAPSRAVVVDRSSHGSIRHADTHVVQRPVEVRREPERPAEVRHEVAPRHEVVVHRDVDVDLHRQRFWNDFSFHRRLSVLPLGFRALRIGALAYFYFDGIYYQPADGGYEEVYPPVGAAIPEPPEGAFEVVAGGQVYYYAGGAFYVQQPDGTYAIAPTPIGVVVPELPPGAVQVSVNGGVAYQFNGIYYEPVFVDGVTQYQTFMP